MSRQNITRREFRVTIRRANGFGTYIEWRLTREAAEKLRESYDVVSIEEADHLLDY